MSRRATLAVFVILLLLASRPDTAWSRKTLRVGIRPSSPPFSFLALKNGQKSIRGYAVDECLMIGKTINAQMEFVPVDDLQERRKMLEAGQIDLIAYDAAIHAGNGVTFIPVGLSLRHHLYVHRKCSSVTCLRDLQDKRTVVVISAPYDMPHGDQDSTGGEVIPVTSPLEALSMLDQGVVDVFLAPSEQVADFLIDSNQFQNVLKKGVVLGEMPLGILIASRNEGLADEIRAARSFLERGRHLERLNEKWFGRAVGGLDLRKYYKHMAATGGGIVAIFMAFTLWNVSLKRRVALVANDLRRTEQRYRDLIESSPDMIFLVARSGHVLHANERARSALLQEPPPAMFDFRQVVAPEDATDVDAFLDKVFDDGCDKYEFVFKTRDGQPMEVEVAGRIVQGQAGTEQQACLFARNVTERNRMEAELIQSERLGIIGKMAASVAHEINNPLGIIQANAEDLLFADCPSAEVREGLRAILRNATRAGEITTGLLDLASPKPLSNDVLSLEEVVRESLALLGPKLKSLRLELRFPESPLLVRGDARSLQQVIVNLVLNSIESMDGRGSVAIAGRTEGCGSGKTVVLVVKDTGRGIPRQDLSNIFEPFFTSRKTGFGLGLFITRRIVERHGGVLFVESELGKGTRMIIELPALNEGEE